MEVALAGEPEVAPHRDVALAEIRIDDALEEGFPYIYRFLLVHRLNLLVLIRLE